MRSIRFFGIWQKILNSRIISGLAQSSGFRKREPRKLKPTQLYWATVLSFGTEAERTQAGVTRLAGMFSGEPVSRQAVHDRLKQSTAVAFFAGVYQAVLGRALELIREPLPEAYQCFEDISLLDSTTLKLADRLANQAMDQGEGPTPPQTLRFVAVVESGKLRPLTPLPELEEGAEYEVRAIRSR